MNVNLAEAALETVLHSVGRAIHLQDLQRQQLVPFATAVTIQALSKLQD
jgi:hypothetical protein